MITSVLIAYSASRHNLHHQILKDLAEANVAIDEIDLPLQASQPCQLTEELEQRVSPVDLVLIYLSKTTAGNACITSCISIAQRLNKRIIGIWTEDADIGDLNPSMDQYGDSIFPYTSNQDLASQLEHDCWVSPEGSEIPKRKINKHTCG